MTANGNLAYDASTKCKPHNAKKHFKVSNSKTGKEQEQLSIKRHICDSVTHL